MEGSLTKAPFWEGTWWPLSIVVGALGAEGGAEEDKGSSAGRQGAGPSQGDPFPQQAVRWAEALVSGSGCAGPARPIAHLPLPEVFLWARGDLAYISQTWMVEKGRHALCKRLAIG